MQEIQGYKNGYGSRSKMHTCTCKWKTNVLSLYIFNLLHRFISEKRSGTLTCFMSMNVKIYWKDFMYCVIGSDIFLVKFVYMSIFERNLSMSYSSFYKMFSILMFSIQKLIYLFAKCTIVVFSISYSKYTILYK